MDLAEPAVRAAETVALQVVRPDHRAVRTAASACSRAAERGLLWAGLSAAAAASTTTRRAGIEALAGWAAASGAAFALKTAARRRRPALPWAFGSAPSSSSMPSSHTAGAFGYATAATLRTPAVGIIVVPAALAVAWSRAATGRHFPTDIAAGLALGATAGAVVHIGASRCPSRSPDAGRTDSHYDLRSAMPG